MLSYWIGDWYLTIDNLYHSPKMTNPSVALTILPTIVLWNRIVEDLFLQGQIRKCRKEPRIPCTIEIEINKREWK
jgi:hypothetical protein